MCKCWSTHHILYMLAGASFWEALGHVLLHFSGAVPVSIGSFLLTRQINLLIVGVGLLLGFVFLYLASKSGDHPNCSSC